MYRGTFSGKSKFLSNVGSGADPPPGDPGLGVPLPDTGPPSPVAFNVCINRGVINGHWVFELVFELIFYL